ncbi:MAG: hypothetical protein ACK4V2_05680 [Pseudomonadota bacterium]|jgi:hypothetical protein|nr:hypothetical protein [Alphaproteobacteria bacterium]
MVKKSTRKKCESNEQSTFWENIFNAANEGSFLHQLYKNEQINESHFQAGLAFEKLYRLAMRSLNICSRVHTSSQRWDQLYGITHDKFSYQKIEGLWRLLLRALDPIYHDGLSMREIAFSLILLSQKKSYSLNDIKKTLGYIQSIWEKIENTPYHLGLYSSKNSLKMKSFK